MGTRPPHPRFPATVWPLAVPRHLLAFRPVCFSMHCSFCRFPFFSNPLAFLSPLEIPAPLKLSSAGVPIPYSTSMELFRWIFSEDFSFYVGAYWLHYYFCASTPVGWGAPELVVQGVWYSTVFVEKVEIYFSLFKATNRKGQETYYTAAKFVLATGERPRYLGIRGDKEYCITR